jgi:hypothetical protein
MPAKGYRKHKCKGCNTPRTTAGDFCIACIEKHLKKEVK